MVFLNKVVSEETLERATIIDSQKLFSRDIEEDRIEKDLAKIIKDPKYITTHQEELQTKIGEFISNVSSILTILEDEKRKVLEKELRNLKDIRETLLSAKNSKIMQKKLIEVKEKLKETLLRDMRKEQNLDRKVMHGVEPRGYILTKIKNDKSIDRRNLAEEKIIITKNVEEHKLMKEINSLIEQLKTTSSEEAFKRLKLMVEKLLSDYEKDIDYFLNIEVDISIEQARKIHRIDHYITFLNMHKNKIQGDIHSKLLSELTELRKRATTWVYQDNLSKTKLIQYAMSVDSGIEMQKENELKLNEMNEIVESKFLLEGHITGILMRPTKNPNPKRGLVLVHGITGNKESLITLGKRFVRQGYVIYAIDMTSHGDNTMSFSLGQSSSDIIESVKFLRSMGAKKVGVLGHSAGGSAAIYASMGYNKFIEDHFFNSITKLLEITTELSNLEKNNKNGEQDTEIKSKLEVFSEIYTNTKRIVLQGLKELYSGNGRANAITLLSAPQTFQKVFPVGAGKFLKHVPKKILQVTLKGVTGLVGIGTRKLSEDIRYHQISKEETGLQMNSLFIRNVNEFFEYIMSINNPYDYINFINFLSDKVENNKENSFFKYYRDKIIIPLPKLFIVGMQDNILKTKNDNVLKDLLKHYKSIGHTKIETLWNVDHNLNVEGRIDLAYEIGRLPKLTRTTMKFFQEYMGNDEIDWSNDKSTTTK